MSLLDGNGDEQPWHVKGTATDVARAAPVRFAEPLFVFLVPLGIMEKAMVGAEMSEITLSESSGICMVDLPFGALTGLAAALNGGTSGGTYWV